MVSKFLIDCFDIALSELLFQESIHDKRFGYTHKMILDKYLINNRIYIEKYGPAIQSSVSGTLNDCKYYETLVTAFLLCIHQRCGEDSIVRFLCTDIYQCIANELFDFYVLYIDDINPEYCMIGVNKSEPYVKYTYKPFSEEKQKVLTKNQLMVSKQQAKETEYDRYKTYIMSNESYDKFLRMTELQQIFFYINGVIPHCGIVYDNNSDNSAESSSEESSDSEILFNGSGSRPSYIRHGEEYDSDEDF